MGKRLNTKEFVERSKIIHNNLYDYSLVNYVNKRTKVKIVCQEHGIFEQTPDHHLYQKNGCNKCGGTSKSTNSEFIIKAEKIYNNKYDYSKVEYVNNKEKVDIICSKHGIFQQRPNEHLNGNGCNKCGILKQIKHIEYDNTIFINKANKIHNKLYDYSLVEYKEHKINVNIICPIHGVFKQKPTTHLQGCGCQKCKSSKGEEKIRNYLREKNISFKEQYKFDDCEYKNKLVFDFYLPEHNTCIEYDGKQHFKIVEYFGGRSGFMKRKHRDKIKNQYCIDNNINLIRIPYTNFDNIGNHIIDIFSKK